MMRRRGIVRATLVAVALAQAAPASADFLVPYELAGQPGDQATNPATFAAPGTTGVHLARGPGLTPTAGANSMNSAGWVGPAADDF